MGSLVDVKSRTDTEGNPLTEQELVEKANRTLELMTKDPATFPEGERFTAVSKLKKGGLLYEVSSARMAKWLLKADNMAAFGKSFGYEAVVRERGYLVFFRNVPVFFLPSEQAYRTLERENGWETRSIMTCHWMKPLEKRRRGQMTGHMLVKFRTLKAANDAIEYGASVMGRKIHTEKQPKEARRCLKCQKFEPSHLAAQCKGDETCGSCTSTEHRTQECTASVMEWKCVNCDELGHASWDRTCPSFIRANRKLQQSDPTSKYRFYPDLEDPRTWELRSGWTDWEAIPVTSPPSRAPPPHVHPPRLGQIISNDWLQDVTHASQDRPSVEYPRRKTFAIHKGDDRLRLPGKEGLDPRRSAK
ncbi:hypothetical protein EVJ58_g9981 [Rhodofomes roseus]|uniref:Uncharacterized protein n=1 Tax=Rhodofomes roseus TaxID=34475 RepID=A0A4Y9XR02_9APHY|nr:hypothetical protein EVJ58_g9981 [Rhodofomes roseus]